MNKLNFRSMAVLSLSVLTLAACGGGKEEDSPSNGVGAVALPSSVKDLSFQRCEAVTGAGSSLAGKVVTKYLQLNSDGTYTFQVWYSSSTSCTGTAGAGVAGGGQMAAGGGEDVFRYNQSGTYAAGNMASDGSYPVTFLITANSFTARTGTLGTQMRTAINTNCTMSMTGGSNFSVPNSTTCLSTDGTFIVPTPPATSLSIAQRIEITTRGIKIGSESGLFTPGFLGTTAPTTSTVSYLTY